MTKYLVPITRSSMSTPLLEEFDKLFNEFFTNTFNTTIRPNSKNQNPKLNAYKKDGKYCIDAVIPMASKEDIDVEIDEAILKITVKAHHDLEVKEDDFIIREISRGQTVRSLQLGEDVDVASVKSTFKDGVLHIEFDAKQAPEPKAKKVAIE